MISSIEGQISDAEGMLLHRYAARVKSGCTVEVGGHRGKSTVALGLGSLSGSSIPVFSIDAHEELSGVKDKQLASAQRGKILENIVRARVAEIVRLVNLPSEFVARCWSRSVALLWIDCDQPCEAVRAEFQTWGPLVVPGGFVVLHDATNPPLDRHRMVQEALAAGAFQQVEVSGATVVFQKNSNGGLTNYCSELLARASAHFPPSPIGPMLFQGCPHVPSHFFIFHMPWLMTQNVIYGLSYTVRPSSYLEVGSCWGSSLLAMVRGGHGSISRILSIDMMEETQRIARENLLRSGYGGECEFTVGNRHQVELPGQFDMVYVDGDHSFEGARDDIVKFWDCVRPGGYMLVDNTVNNLLPKTSAEGYSYEGASRITKFAVLEAMVDAVAQDRLPGLGSVVYQFPSWSGLGLLYKLPDIPDSTADSQAKKPA